MGRVAESGMVCNICTRAPLQNTLVEHFVLGAISGGHSYRYYTGTIGKAQYAARPYTRVRYGGVCAYLIVACLYIDWGLVNPTVRQGALWLRSTVVLSLSGVHGNRYRGTDIVKPPGPLSSSDPRSDGRLPFTCPTRNVVQPRATCASLLPPVVWEGFYVQVLRKVDSNDIISTVKWSAWPKVAWFAIPAHRTLSKTLW